MCLIVDSELRTAKKDFYVLKKFDNIDRDVKLSTKVFYSYYKSARQELGKLMKESGFNKEAETEDTITGNCIHSYTIDHWKVDSYLPGSRNTGILLARIPKGSLYYLGRRNEIGSNQLILEELIVSGRELPGFEPICHKTAYKQLRKMLRGYNLKPS